jgi:drug/metabolite transporter (DMT)-like permease
MRLSVVLPILASVFWWGEQPTQAQIAGIAATLVALVLLGGRGLSGASDLRVWMLTGFLFLTSGGASVVSKAFLVLHLPDAKTTYTAVLFGTAALGGSLSFLTSRFRPTREDVGEGVLVGVTNVVATGIQLVATAVFCAIVWKERFTRRMLIGMGIAVVGLALVNMR